MRHRVVVTGLGCVTPIGLSAQESFKSLLAGRVGIKNLLECPSWTHLHPQLSHVATPFAAPILEIDPKPSADLKRPRSHLLAELAADEAIKDSGLGNLTNTGVYFGVGLPEFEILSETFPNISSQGYRRISPHFIPSILGNSPAAYLSKKFKLKGPLNSPSLACSTGSFAIGDAFRVLRDPEVHCDSILAGAADCPINIPTIYGFSRLRALCSDRNLDPVKASRPFDVKRSGFVLGEGAGCVILERLESALKRNARIYAEIIGFGSYSDGFDHPTAPDPSNHGAVQAIKAALSTNDFELVSVNAHATSTIIGDEIELAALEKFIKNPNSVSVVSNKSSFGHLLGASGAVESIASILSLYQSHIPANLNLDGKIPTRLHLPTKITNIPHEIRNAAILKTSFGFGGVNAALLFKKYQT